MISERQKRLMGRVSVEATVLKSQGFSAYEILEAFKYFLQEAQVPKFLLKEKEHA